MVSQLTKLLCCLTSDLFARTLFAASFYRGTDVFQWSSMRPPCWRNSAFATYSSTSVFGTVAHSEESWQVLKDLLVRYRLGGSSDDCLSEEKTGLSLKSQDPVSPVRALLIVSIKLECSNWVRHYLSINLGLIVTAVRLTNSTSSAISFLSDGLQGSNIICAAYQP